MRVGEGGTLGTNGVYDYYLYYVYTMETDTHLYTLTRSQFAKEIGKSREAVKKDMQRGKYKELYIFKNNQYYFKTREAVRDFKDLSPYKLSPGKRKINRGNHDNAVRNGNYPNQSFAEHNHMKKYLKARGNLSAKQLNLVPEIERRVKEEEVQQKRKTLEGTPGVNPLGRHNYKSYGGMMSQREMQRWDYQPTKRGKDNEDYEYY